MISIPIISKPLYAASFLHSLKASIYLTLADYADKSGV